MKRTLTNDQVIKRIIEKSQRGKSGIMLQISEAIGQPHESVRKVMRGNRPGRKYHHKRWFDIAEKILLGGKVKRVNESDNC